ncbi:hypothetical protein BD310DRAFT_194079 [Dichomitus squalens]|uniref:Uncharacterized protein n=1 Tax=Dichomitus squalens TaxID=114155 RepID=A0A4Q9Q2D8_9APHY|nr:hypothetical protein BD310DRAFT_194079 [Dichomitus squalens]
MLQTLQFCSYGWRSQPSLTIGCGFSLNTASLQPTRASRLSHLLRINESYVIPLTANLW